MGDGDEHVFKARFLQNLQHLHVWGVMMSTLSNHAFCNNFKTQHVRMEVVMCKMNQRTLCDNVIKFLEWGGLYETREKRKLSIKMVMGCVVEHG